MLLPAALFMFWADIIYIYTYSYHIHKYDMNIYIHIYIYTADIVRGVLATRLSWISLGDAFLYIYIYI
jgi:hypothetical protein